MVAGDRAGVELLTVQRALASQRLRKLFYQGSGFKGQGLGFRVQGLGFKGSGLRV